jgi:hypothetical protein
VDWNILLGGYTGWRVFSAHMMAEHVACMNEKRNSYSVSLGKPEERKPLGKLSICKRIRLKLD